MLRAGALSEAELRTPTGELRQMLFSRLFGSMVNSRIDRLCAVATLTLSPETLRHPTTARVCGKVAVQQLISQRLTVIDDSLDASIISQARGEAEALQREGKLREIASHRIKGDRGDHVLWLHHEANKNRDATPLPPALKAVAELLGGLAAELSR